MDNARIEIEGGPEVPVVDGSALGWAIEIHAVSLMEQSGLGKSTAVSTKTNSMQ